MKLTWFRTVKPPLKRMVPFPLMVCLLLVFTVDDAFARAEYGDVLNAACVDAVPPNPYTLGNCSLCHEGFNFPAPTEEKDAYLAAVESNDFSFFCITPTVNTAPELAPIGGKTVDEGSALTFSVVASDEDADDSLTYSVDALPAGATFVDGIFTWTPSFEAAGDIAVTFSVTDDGVPAASDSEVVVITVRDVNRKPSIEPIDDVAVNEGELIDYTVTVSDPDNDGVTINVTGLPVGASFVTSADGGAFGWSPGADDAGTYLITYTAVDDGLPPATAQSSMTISVIDVNRAPVWIQPDNQTIDEGALLTLSVSAQDPDNNDLVLSAVSLPGNAAFADNGNGTGDFSWTPGAADAGTYVVELAAMDAGIPRLSTTVTFIVTVNDVAPNSAPTLAPIGNKMTLENATLTFAIEASDVDEDALSLSVIGLPDANLADNGDGTGVFTWTPPLASAGVYPVTITVVDDGVPILSDSEQIMITVGVEEANQPPVLASIGAQMVTVGETLNVSLSATDPDDDTLSFTAGDLPTGAQLVDNGDGSAAINWTPLESQAGPVDIIVTVTDNGEPPLSDFESFSIVVGDANMSPVLSPIGNHVVTVGSALELTITASDPEAGNLSFELGGIPDGASFVDNNNGSATFSWIPDLDDIGTITLTCVVSDDGDPIESDSEEFSITVSEDVVVNQPPVLAPIGNKSVVEEELLTFMVNASDPNGDQLTIVANALPEGAEFDAMGNGIYRFAWIPLPADVGNHSLTFVATDNGEPPLSDEQAIVITVDAAVGEINKPPVIEPFGARSVEAGKILSIMLSAKDPDGDQLLFRVEEGPDAVVLIDNGDGTALLEWETTADDIGDSDLTVTVYDDGEPELSASYTGKVSVVPEVDDDGNLRIRKAKWVDSRSMLYVQGRLQSAGEQRRGKHGFRNRGARQLVTLFDADSGARLGATLTRQQGHWRFRTWTRNGPCRIRVEAADSVAFADVKHAPCRQQVRLKISKAKWEERRGRLVVQGWARVGGAPHARIEVKVTDSESGESIARTRSHRNGQWRVVLRVEQPPCEITAFARNAEVDRRVRNAQCRAFLIDEEPADASKEN